MDLPLGVTTTFSWVWLLLIIPIAAVLAYWLYHKDPILKDQPIGVRIGLFLLRFFVISMLGLLLLEPLTRQISYDTQKPILAIAFDNSASMLNYSDSAALKDGVLEVAGEKFKNLSETYEIDYYQFGKEFSELKALDFKDRETNISQLMEQINGRYFNRNLGGIVLFTDGNYNIGYNPIYTRSVSLAPIYTIAYGDTARPSDLKITDVNTNSIAFLGDEFPIEIAFEAFGMINENYRLKIFHKGKLVSKTQGQITTDSWSHRQKILLPADANGIQRYDVVIETNEPKNKQVNNRETFYIEILDERLTIAIVSSFPHPDVAVWREVIAASKNYDVKVLKPEEIGKFKDEVALFVIYQGPIKVDEVAFYQSAIESNVPFFLVAGLSSNPQWINQIQAHYRIDLTSATKEQFGVSLSPSFSLFDPDKRISRTFLSAPPLSFYLNETRVTKPYQTLLTKKIANLETSVPVWVMTESTSPRSALLLGEGIWRWRMDAFAQGFGTEWVDDFLRQTIKYLIRKSKNKSFKIELPEKVFEGDKLNVLAEVLNPSLEPVKNAEISLVITNEENQDFSYSFIEQDKNYSLAIGPLAPGEYLYKGSVNMGGKTLIDKGIFVVRKKENEKRDLRSNLPLLNQLASSTGGQLYYPDQLDLLVAQFDENDLPAINYSSESFVEWIHIEWIFFIIFAALIIEWFFRRFLGTY